MADLKISELRAITDTQLVAADLFAVADVSATETRKLTALDQAKATVRLIPDGTIPYSKIDPNTIDIPDGSVNTDDLADGSVTHEKLADDAVETNNILDGAVTGPKIDPAAFNRGIDSTAGLIGITNAIAPGTHAGITYDEQGLITGTTALVPATDLPIATTTEVGVVSVPPAGGLAVAGTGAVSIANNIAPDTKTKITYDEHGLVVGGADLEGTDLPVATETTLGAVSVPTDGNLRVNDGAVRMRTSGVTPGAGYTKFTCNEFGVVTSATTLDASDIPEISADLITSGEIGSDQLANCSVTAPKICDYATCLMQEDNPGRGDFLGQFWYTPSTAQLRVYSRGSGPENIWLPVGFGALQANNLRWLGTYHADTDTIGSLTALGVSEGLVAGGPFPTATDAMSGGYFLCQTPGNAMSQPSLNGITHDAGDWALCLDATQGWIHIDAAASGGGGGGGSTQYLNDLLDVEIGGAGGPFSTAPSLALSNLNLLKYDGGDGMWRNTNLIDGGTF